MLFLTGLSIIAKDGSNIEAEESIVECSRYLLKERDKIFNNENSEEIYLNYKSETIRNLFDLAKFLIDSKDINSQDFDFIEMSELFNKLDFKLETWEIVLQNLLTILFKKYGEGYKSMDYLLGNKKFQEVLSKYFLESFQDSGQCMFISSDIYFEFFEKITKFANLKFNINLLDSDKNYDSPVFQRILSHPRLNILMITFYNSKNKILENLSSNKNISYNVKNMVLNIYRTTNINSISKFSNLQRLQIWNQCSSKSIINIPELKNLYALKIFSESMKCIKFSKIESLKILIFNYLNKMKLDNIQLNEYFPNLEIITIKYIDLNTKTDIKKLINLCHELKNLKIISVSVTKKVKSIKTINKLKEKIPQIIIRCEFFNNKHPIFHNNDIDPIIFCGESINISEIYSLDFSSNFYFESLYFEKSIPFYDFTRNGCNKFYTENLYLSKLNFNNDLFGIFKKLKNIKAIIIKNVEFEAKSFNNFIDNFLYDIEVLKIYNCKIPKNELKIIKKIKFLRILNLLFPKESEDENFCVLFEEMNHFEFPKLKILNYISNDNKKRRSQFNMKNKDVKINIYKL